MFFILSKVLVFVLNPLNWMALLAIFSMVTRNKRRQRRAVKALIAVLLVFSNPWLVNQLARTWETGQRSPRDIRQAYDAGILLGGYVNFNAESPTGVLTLHQAGNRLTSALMLYQTGRIKRIILSGGDGRLIGGVPPEAAAARDFLLACGVPDTALIVEARSRNTHENALFSKRIADSLELGRRCLLVTSAWHMRRAVACFDKAGLACDPFGVDFMTESSRGNWFQWIEPDWKALMKWEFLLKEWTGWVMYKVQGYV